ncbi:MAG: hypothetical protein HGA19_19040 [Oscillochloris sp.]|nr:hypothetical protein [Oscillochloris sp.]
MTSSPQPDRAPVLRVMSLAELHRHCDAQLALFQRSHNSGQDSSSCEEILRRAASGDGNAFVLLWEITIPLIHPNCPPQCRDTLDDLQQEVAIRVINTLATTLTISATDAVTAYWANQPAPKRLPVGEPERLQSWVGRHYTSQKQKHIPYVTSM